jgi:DNA-binding GntR family transcriptional regulator
MPNRKFSRNGWASQSEQAYSLILDRILRGRLAVGAPLSRRSTAEDLKLGLQPVTEALQRLEGEGLLESRPRIGTRVRVPSDQEIRGHYIVREALESQAARLFAEKASAVEREELSDLAVRLDVLYGGAGQSVHPQADDDYWYQVRQQHARFHLRIAECTGCQQLGDAMKKNQILVFNWVYDVSVESIESKDPEGWHARLMGGLNSGSVEQADAAMRRHVRYGMERIIEHMTQLAQLEDSTRGNLENAIS